MVAVLAVEVEEGGEGDDEGGGEERDGDADGNEVVGGRGRRGRGVREEEGGDVGGECGEVGGGRRWGRRDGGKERSLWG